MVAPTVSIIVPAYNAAGTIIRALQSVFGQTFTDYEVIVVDDGSSDDIARVIAPYLSRVRFISQANAGAAAARNRGAQIAGGTYLAFLDADDVWHPRKLESQVETFHRHRDIAYCTTAGTKTERVPSTAVLRDSSIEPATIVSDFARIFAKPYFGTPGLMIPRELFLGIGGFREHLRSAEDVDLFLRAAYGRVVAIIPTILFFIFSGPDSLTATHGDSTYEDNLAVINEFCQSHPEFASSSRDVVRRARARVFEMWGSTALARGDTGLARSVLTRALRERITVRSTYLLVKVIVAEVLNLSPSGPVHQ